MPRRSATTVKIKAYKDLDISYWQLIFCNLFTVKELMLDKPIMLFVERILEELVIDVFSLPEGLVNARQAQFVDVFVFLLEFSTVIGIPLGELISSRYYAKYGIGQRPLCPHCLLPNCLCGLIEEEYRGSLIRGIYNADVQNIENEMRNKLKKFIIDWLNGLKNLYIRYKQDVMDKYLSEPYLEKNEKKKKKQKRWFILKKFLFLKML